MSDRDPESGTKPCSPSSENGFLAEHASILRNSLKSLGGPDLVGADLAGTDLAGEEAARYLFQAPFALVSHDTEPDPVFNYANEAALRLFELTWDEFTRMPSRLSAEPVHRNERARLLAEVNEHGIIRNYRGIRISKSGRRFLIEDGTVWNLLDEHHRPCGQAACFSRWRFLPANRPGSEE